MTDQEIIRMFRSDPTWMGQEIANRFEELLKERDALKDKLARAVKALAWFFYADATSSQKDVARAALAELEK